MRGYASMRVEDRDIEDLRGWSGNWRSEGNYECLHKHIAFSSTPIVVSLFPLLLILV